MKWSVEISQKGQDDINRLDESVRIKIEDKIIWLAEHAEEIIHQHLKSLPEDLIGLCKMRVGDWRILYWPHENIKTLRIYRIFHRSIAYKNL